MRHRLLQNSLESEQNWSTSSHVQVRTGVFLCDRPVTGETSISSIFDDLLVLSLCIPIHCLPRKK
jgi:hypothetical protein